MHDALGKPLKVGDAVILMATITQLNETENYCNVSIKSTLGRRPDQSRETVSAINTGILVKVGE